MTIADIKGKFSNDVLTAVEGDKELRYLLYMPLFSSLYESKVVYHERFTCIVKLQNIDITPDYFSAFVVPQIHIRTNTPSDKRHEGLLDRLSNGWEAICRWDFMRLIWK